MSPEWQQAWVSVFRLRHEEEELKDSLENIQDHRDGVVKGHQGNYMSKDRKARNSLEPVTTKRVKGVPRLSRQIT